MTVTEWIIQNPDNTLSVAARAIQTLAGHYARRAGEDDSVGYELTHVLDSLQFPEAPRGELEEKAHPIREHLAGPQSSVSGTVGDVLDAFRVLFPVLPWRYGYDPRPDFPGLEKRMAWAELVGPVAPFRNERICVGITVIAPHTRYAEHFHPAIESYYVLSGTAYWTAAGVSTLQKPGAYILHPENVEHVMETTDETLIAAYTWSGDIVTSSVFSRPPLAGL
jgi:quercetin dioxygenase-like cupin family protein